MLRIRWVLTGGVIAFDRVCDCIFNSCLDTNVIFSQAVKVGPTLYLSGSIGIDPATNEFAGPDVETQTNQVSSCHY